LGPDKGALARLELPQPCLDFPDISSVPFSGPGLGTGAPHLGAADGHAAAVPGSSSWSRIERRGRVCQGREYEFGWDVFAEGAVDLVHLLTFCVRFLLLVVEGVGGWGRWTHGKVINNRRQMSGNLAELGLPDTMVIRGDHDRIEVKDEGMGMVVVLRTARHRHGVGGGQIHRG